MTTLFLSDVHLDVRPVGQDRTADFVSFLRRIDTHRVDRLVILGDLFDFWFEYQHVVFSGYFDVLRGLADLRDAGVALDLVCGNHDFWAGRFLIQQLAFHVHRDGVRLDLGGRRVLALHGDGLNPKDWGYRLYKRIARAPLVVSAFRVLHPDWAMALAQRVSRTSRVITRADDLSMSAETQALRAFARQTLAQGDADVVVCGHSHYPLYEEYPTPSGTGLYINTGDWFLHRSHVEYDGTEFRLHRRDAG
ncbi:MAG TPA: UDP-2,3-diacylglucosamine diphosphatase [Candidatus Hydrogenedentes bacterium]|nr:UDP-2,3-diacylglucosamine diphosphatase [Candidatus Hydrogenedentota bacterium]HPG66443.1 UDP-2,3-diacylglucosamine diphosphatase [Candidatus Hydrogenedentota bacterium]